MMLVQDIPHKKIPKSLKLKSIPKRCDKKLAFNSLHVKETSTKKKKKVPENTTTTRKKKARYVEASKILKP